VSPGLCSIQVASYGPDTWSNEAGLTGINYKAANRGGLGAASILTSILNTSYAIPDFAAVSS